MSPPPGRPPRRAELTEAARSVAKVWLLRHQIQGVALPAGLPRPAPRGPRRPTTSRARHDRAGRPAPATPIGRQRPKQLGATTRARGGAEPHTTSGPSSRTYWCGPTSMQMITWGWSTTRSPAALGHQARHDLAAAPRSPHGRRREPQHRLGQRGVRRGVHRPGHQRLVFRQWMLLMAPHRRLQGAGDPAPGPAEEVLPLPRRRRLRPLPGRPRLPEARRQAPCSATSSRGTSSASTPPSPTSRACSGARRTAPTARTRRTSSTTSASDAVRRRRYADRRAALLLAPLLRSAAASRRSAPPAAAPRVGRSAATSRHPSS